VVFEFQKLNDSVEDAECLGHPSTSKTDENDTNYGIYSR
jgi:hypothetical protein